MSFANGMSTQHLQDVIERRLKNTKRRLPAAIENSPYSTHASRNTFFFDDFNAAATDGTPSNNQPLLELVRSLLSLGKSSELLHHAFSECRLSTRG